MRTRPALNAIIGLAVLATVLAMFMLGLAAGRRDLARHTAPASRCSGSVPAGRGGCGRAEWLWRTLTYGVRQPLRRAAA